MPHISERIGIKSFQNAIRQRMENDRAVRFCAKFLYNNQP